MDFITSCGCFHCCISSDKGSYNTYDRERNQASKSPTEEQQVESNNNNNTTLNRQQCQQTSQQIESQASKNMGKFPFIR